MQLIKKVNKTINNKEISQQEKDKLLYILKVEIKTAINNIIIAGTKTPLNTVFIALRNKRESIYSKLSR